VYAPTEDKDDVIKDKFYKELEQAFDQFPRYHMKILLGDFNVNVRREDIFNPIIGNESLHEARNDNGARVVNSATLKNLSRAQHSHTTTFINILGLLLMVSHIIRQMSLKTKNNIQIYLIS
jgi:exonuclease III